MDAKFLFDDELCALQDRILAVRAGRDDGEGLLEHPRYEEALRAVALLRVAVLSPQEREVHAAERESPHSERNVQGNAREPQVIGGDPYFQALSKREFLKGLAATAATVTGIGAIIFGIHQQSNANEFRTKLNDAQKGRDQAEKERDDARAKLERAVADLNAQGYLNPVSFSPTTPAFLISGRREVIVSCAVKKTIRRLEITWDQEHAPAEVETIEVTPEMFPGSRAEATITKRHFYTLDGSKVVAHIKAVPKDEDKELIDQAGNTAKEREQTSVFLCSTGGIVFAEPDDRGPDPERRLALWTLSQGGKVGIHGNATEFSKPDDLPDGDLKVQKVDLAGCHGSDKWLREGLRSDGIWLQYLTLAHNPQLTDESFEYIATAYPWLWGIFAAQSGLTDRGLVPLGKLKSLNLLAINDTAVSKLDPLLEAKALLTLHLERTQVGDDAVPVLSKMTQLMQLRITGSKISSAGVAELRKALPNCKIE